MRTALSLFIYGKSLKTSPTTSFVPRGIISFIPLDTMLLISDLFRINYFGSTDFES